MRCDGDAGFGGEQVHRAPKRGEPVAEVGAQPQERLHRVPYRCGAVAAAATPSMPSRSAAFGLCTTAVTGDAVEREDVVGDRCGHRFDQVERTLLHDRPDGLGDAAVVGGALDVVVADVDLDVQVDDEVLRLVLLTRTRAVMTGRTDAGQEQPRRRHSAPPPVVDVVPCIFLVFRQVDPRRPALELDRHDARAVAVGPCGSCRYRARRYS